MWKIDLSKIEIGWCLLMVTNYGVTTVHVATSEIMNCTTKINCITVARLRKLATRGARRFHQSRTHATTDRSLDLTFRRNFTEVIVY